MMDGSLSTSVVFSTESAAASSASGPHQRRNDHARQQVGHKLLPVLSREAAVGECRFSHRSRFLHSLVAVHAAAVHNRGTDLAQPTPVCCCALSGARVEQSQLLLPIDPEASTIVSLAARLRSR